MAFEKFKATHGGFGPFQAFYSGLTEGEGLLGQWRPKVVREQWEAAFDAIRDDPDIDTDFKRQAASVRHGNYTAPQMLSIIGQVQQRASDLKTIGAGVAGVTDELDRLEEQAAGAGDLQQIGALRTRADLARRFATSGNPDLEKQGQAELLKLTSDLQAFTTTNEAQQLARDTADAQARRELGNERWNRFNTLTDDLRTESASFLTQREAFARMKSLLEVDSEAADYGLLYAWNKILDPGSVVRESEFANAQNLAGVPDAIVTLRNALNEGKRLTPEKRRDIFEQTQKIYTGAQAQQAERNSRALERGRAGEIPDNYLDSLVIPLAAPGKTPTSFGEPAPPAPSSPAAIAARLPPEERLDSDSTATKVGQAVASGAQTFGRQMLDFAGGVAGVSSRPTDEYAPAPTRESLPELLEQRDEDVRGIVARRARRRRERLEQRSAGSVSGVIER